MLLTVYYCLTLREFCGLEEMDEEKVMFKYYKKHCLKEYLASIYYFPSNSYKYGSTKKMIKNGNIYYFITYHKQLLGS